ncbi:MAG TPA: hypothetical protein VM076_12390 [Gemmatimonadaceae bacterium]|nr:hypothetical protein [Gemmatimonadaceae bacterium]
MAVIIASAACQGDAPGKNAAATSAAARAAQRCNAADASLVIDSIGIGPIVRGRRVAELRDRCTVTDTAITLSEGMVERAHVIDAGGHALIALSTGTPDTSIIRVITTDPAFKSSGGVGVGSSVQALRLAHGSLCAAQGEGNFIVMASELPGVSFAIDWSPPPSRDPSAATSPFPGGDPGTALDATRITKAWVHGVTGGCRVGLG